MRKILIAGACLVTLIGLPSAARADGYVSPFIGANFGGSVGTPLNVATRNRNRAAFGAQFGGMGGGIFGAEVDFSYTRNFFTESEGIIESNTLLTVVPALIIGVPIGGQQGAGIRPYFTAGVGLVRRDFDFGSLLSLSKNDPAYSLGGGVMGFLGDHVGLRGDVRYFRNFKVDEFSFTGVSFDRGTFNFGRASIGAVFRF
jgi:opacity protein-like surface antigen